MAMKQLFVVFYFYEMAYETKRGAERQIQRERKRQRDRQTERERQTDRQTERQTDIQRETDRQTQTERERERDLKPWLSSSLVCSSCVKQHDESTLGKGDE